MALQSIAANEFRFPVAEDKRFFSPRESGKSPREKSVRWEQGGAFGAKQCRLQRRILIAIAIVPGLAAKKKHVLAIAILQLCDFCGEVPEVADKVPLTGADFSTGTLLRLASAIREGPQLLLSNRLHALGALPVQGVLQVSDGLLEGRFRTERGQVQRCSHATERVDLAGRSCRRGSGCPRRRTWRGAPPAPPAAVSPTGQTSRLRTLLALAPAG
jgi:hypothetical protein